MPMGDWLYGPASGVIAAAIRERARSLEPGAYINLVPLLPPATAATPWLNGCSGTPVGAAASAKRVASASSSE